MALIKIDDQEVEIAKGEVVINAAKRVGIDIPFYCYHPGMKIVASCRMCLVDMVGMPKLMPACSTAVGELPPGKKLEEKYDAVIYTDNDKVKTARRAVLEFLLLNHPIDCPICDKAGECKLQDYSYEHGNHESRLIDPKRIPEKKDLGPSIYLYTSRCIMCSRCVRFTEEISGTEELKVTHRGWHAEISVAPGKPLDNKMMGNVVDLCPVGCLIDKHEKFEGRVWNFVQTESVCPGCSKGCNTVLDTMKHQKLNLEELVDTVYRIRPRENMDVNQWWICDDGRYHLEDEKKKSRILVPHQRENGKLTETTWFSAVASISERIKSAGAGQVVFIGSPYASNEENYLFGKLAKGLNAATDVSKPTSGDTQTFKTEMNKYPFTIESEKAPNFRGAKDAIGLTDSKIDQSLSKKVVVMLGSHNVELKSKPETLIVIGSFEDAVTKQADILLPAALFTETSGTYTNKDGLVQKFNKAINPQGDSKAVWQIVIDLAQASGLDWYYETIGDVAKEMMLNASGFKSVDLGTLYPQFVLQDEQVVA
ncbi:molybdopterin-dependent oxidoreductase [bacterium]|nr:MAG: molybdopterin-dependent oxidoreductase [bacterium]